MRIIKSDSPISENDQRLNLSKGAAKEWDIDKEELFVIYETNVLDSNLPWNYLKTIATFIPFVVCQCMFNNV